MKGYKCDRCGEFFVDGIMEGTDATGDQALHCPRLRSRQSWDFCGKCTREMVGLNKEGKPKDFEEKYQDAIIRLDRLDEISSAAFTVNCHIKYFKEKIAEEDYEGAVLEADGLVRYAEKLVQTVKESVQ